MANNNESSALVTIRKAKMRENQAYHLECHLVKTETELLRIESGKFSSKELTEGLSRFKNARVYVDQLEDYDDSLGEYRGFGCPHCYEDKIIWKKVTINDDELLHELKDMIASREEAKAKEHQSREEKDMTNSEREERELEEMMSL